MKSASAQIFTFLICVFLPCHAKDIREFKDTTGRSLKASFVSRDGDKVVLMLENGKTASVPLSKLSKQDQDFVAAQEKKGDDASKSVNDALGFPAFTGVGLSQRNATEIAEAMKLPQESEATVGSSWRLYAAVRVPGYKLFGAKPYSVALYSNSEGKAESLSIIFANKGDFGSTAGFAREHFESKTKEEEPSSLDEAMENDQKTIAQTLTKALGEAKEQRYGDSGTRRSVLRWDWNDHSFLLSLVEGEYVSVMVVSTSQADGGGRSARVNDAAVRERLQAGIQRDANGDVHIKGIPMVDQGPKGYCVPATFERAMRYMGIEADMYLLAMVGETSAGGGTSVQLLIDNLRSQVYRKGRRLKETEVKDLRMRDVKREIDAGIPLLWGMCSVDDYNDIADENTSKRRGDGHNSWLEEKRTEIAGRSKPDSNHHLCMIIGYNEKTNELAVSDSWGKQFEIRWVPVEVAAWVNNGDLITILP